jgi:predicted outer membrane repeat protein
VVTTSANVDGNDQITISGQNITSLFVIQPGAALSLMHLTVTKGFANADGGAIRVSSGGLLVIDHCTFSDNHAGDAWSGGAIMSRGALTINNSTFDHNSAGNGGALNPRDGSSSTVISNTLFQQNSTTNTTNGWGGAMLVWVGAAVTIKDSQFVSNTANSGSFTSSTIDRGGAVYVTSNSSLTVDHSQFASNSAFFGGALYVDPGGLLALNGSDLHDNSIGVFDGTQGGGAVYNAGILLADNDQMYDNHAEGAGGAIESANQSALLVQNSVLRHNFAGGGAAIDTNGSTTILTSTLTDNIAELYGGAITTGFIADLNIALTVKASTLSGNSAGSEGGAIESEMHLVLTNVTISGNTGPETIDQYNQPIALTNVTLAQNTGKGLSLHNSAPLQLANTLLAHNTGGNCAAPLTGTLLTSLSTDMTCFLLSGHDGVSLELSPLGNYGGTTLTHMIASGSPAQDHGGFCPATDQRGFPRTGPTAGLACDIGAVERQDGEPFGWVFLPLVRR